MIYTVTLNPAIDYTFSPDRFEPGVINRCKNCFYAPGGKGVNVSLMLAALGMDTTAMGIAAGFSGREAVRLLEEAGCRTDFVFLPRGHSRINVKIRAAGCGETDLNGEGPEIPGEALEQLKEKLSVTASDDGLVLAGSVPRTLGPETYAELLRRVREKDLLTVVDAVGEALLAALPLRPFLIKPNLEELGELFGFPVEDVLTAKECALELQKRGARNVLVSMGEKGALLVPERGEAVFCRAPKGEAVDTVGAGDSMVAGFLYGFRLHGTPEGALRWGTAAGSATAFGSGIASGEEVKRLWPQVGNPHLV